MPAQEHEPDPQYKGGDLDDATLNTLMPAHRALGMDRADGDFLPKFRTMEPRVNIRLSHGMHRKLEDMVLAPGATKSAIMEDALRAFLNSERTATRGDIPLQRLGRLEKRQNAIERDVALCLDTLGHFVLYRLARTMPISENERDTAQPLGQRRTEFFINQVPRRVTSEEPLSKRALPPSAIEDHNE